jgi:glycosyltransferase involved in cell wall biosynthesis
MNILYITQWFSSVGGGGEVVFCDLACGMSKKGHCVHVICHRLSEYEKNIGNYSEGKHKPYVYRIKPVVHGFPPSMVQNVMFILNSVIKGSQLIRKHKIDIIHVNNFAPVIAGWILSRLFSIPVISTIHVVFGISYPNFWKKWSSQRNVSSLKSIVGPVFENLTIKIPVNTIHSVSNATRKDIMRVNSHAKVAVISNGIDLAFYDKFATIIEYRKYVVFIGRLAFNKNLNTIISSFEEIKKKIPDAKLLVIGFGPMLDEWKRMVADLGLVENIHFSEYISQEKKIDLLSKSSALLLPSITEGMPLVALEAFALYKAVLLSDIEPHHDLVDQGSNGFLIPTFDISEWANKIIYLLSNRKVCEELGKKAREKVEKNFTMAKTLKEIESLYHDQTAK